MGLASAFRIDLRRYQVKEAKEIMEVKEIKEVEEIRQGSQSRCFREIELLPVPGNCS
jgi:hypothetical protein